MSVDILLTQHVRSWVSAACAANGWPEPDASYYDAIAARVPPGLRQLLAFGIEDGIVRCEGYTFTLAAQAPGKGPHKWLSDRQWQGGPHPNCEYFVHVGEYVRLSRLAAAGGFRLTFEDQLMDLALYDAETLLVCVEVKEREGQLRDLIAQLTKYAAAVDLAAPDRGVDGLRKAKYVVRRRPLYFYGVALGCRLEYRVEWVSENGFRLLPDVIPYL